jgi:MFS transporter, DHA1 family, inner membrane transport protein
MSTAESTNWLVPISALLGATFAVVSAELMISGLLPAIATDVGVDIPTAGLLITGYAVGVAVAGPILALLTTAVPRKTLLLLIMAVFLVGNALSGLSTNYAALLGSRILVSACHGLFFGVAMVIATSLAPPGRQAMAVSLVMAGVNAATIIGVPLGVAIGNSYGWRAPFWVLLAVGAVAALVIALLIPPMRQERAESNLKRELVAAVRPVALLCYFNIIMLMVGFFCVVTYIAPFLTEAVGISMENVPWVLFAISIAGFGGNLLGGRLGDLNPSVTMIVAISVAGILFFALSLFASNTPVAITLMFFAWSCGFAFAAPTQTRLLQETADAPNFASTLMSTAFQVGIASAAVIGGAAINAGWAYGQLPLLSSVAFGGGLLGTLALVTLHPRQKPALA